jgi:hypothetical protein
VKLSSTRHGATSLVAPISGDGVTVGLATMSAAYDVEIAAKQVVRAPRGDERRRACADRCADRGAVSLDLASTRAHDLGTLALGVLESVGPAAVRGLCVYRGHVRAIVRLDVATDDALEAVAEDRGLGERAIVVLASLGLWYRRASGRWPTLWMVARGPNHEGPPPHA